MITGTRKRYNDRRKAQENQVTLTEAIKKADSVVVTTMVNEDEYNVEITKSAALEIIVIAGAFFSVMNPQNNNFYANESRHSQVAYYNDANNVVYLGR
tara:strand:+ start:152 stop:445 length:294 start_codon:yes stop_codon:yes gene_type:complete